MSCCTGCLGSDGEKILFLEPLLLLDEVKALVLLGMTTVACGIAESNEVFSVVFLIVVPTKFVEDFTTTAMELGVDAEV